MIYIILSVVCALCLILVYKLGHKSAEIEGKEHEVAQIRRQADIANSPRIDYRSVIKQLQKPK